MPVKARKLLAILALWVPAFVVVVTWGIWAEQLPSELPTHWGNSGPADAVTPAPIVFGWCFGIAVVVALGATILLIVPLTGAWVQRVVGGIGAAVAAFVLGIWLGSAASSIGVSDPYTVELGGWLLLTFVLPVYGLVPLFLLPKGAARPVALPDARPIAPVQLSSIDQKAWSHVVTSWLFIVTAAVMLVVVLVLFLPSVVSGGGESLGFALIVSVVAFFLVAVLCAFRVTVDERGFRVISLLFGIPIKRIAVADIENVEVALIEPRSWGGWGYRVMPGRSAIALRTGPGLVITGRDQKQFAISLAAPEVPASLLLGLIEPRDVHGTAK